MKSSRLNRARPPEQTAPGASSHPPVGRAGLGYVAPNQPAYGQQQPQMQPQYGYQPQPPMRGPPPHMQPPPQYGYQQPQYGYQQQPMAPPGYTPYGQQPPQMQPQYNTAVPVAPQPTAGPPKFTLAEVVQVTDQRLTELEKFRSSVEELMHDITPESIGLFMSVMDEINKRKNGTSGNVPSGNVPVNYDQEQMHQP